MMYRIVILAFIIINLNIKLFSTGFGFEVLQGKYTPSIDNNLSRVNVYGIRNNFYLTNNSVLSLKYDIAKQYKNKKNLLRYTFSFRYQVTSLSHNIEPFFELGYGKEGGVSYKSFKVLSFGSKYYLTPIFNVLAEGDYIKKEDSKKDYIIGLGIGIDFNRKCTTSKYSEKPIDESVMINLSKRQINNKIYQSGY